MKIDWTRIRKAITPENLTRWVRGGGGTRFLLSAGAGITTTVLAWYAKVSPEVYRDVILGTVGMYITGSTVQQVKEAISSTTVQVAEITGESPVTNNIGIDGLPIKVELSTKDGSRI